jgi:signal transduction histidine kinase
VVLPVSDESGLVGAAAVFRDISPLLAEIHRIQALVAAAIALAIGAVFLLLHQVYVRSARRIRVEEAERRSALAQVEALHQLSALKDEFVATVSHELRSPLVPLLVYSEALAQGGADPAEAPVLGAEMHRAATRMQRLVEDLLEINRLERGQVRLEPRAVDLAETIGLAARDLVGSAPTHPVALDLEPGLPPVWADEGRLLQVLANLLSNAVRYSPGGGPITIRARRDDDRVVVSVSDRGIGIPADKLPRIFERFYRVENETTRTVRGTGLGLAICKRLIEAQGGTIWVEAQEGVGSTFSFTLPLAARATPAGAAAA